MTEETAPDDDLLRELQAQLQKPFLWSSFNAVGGESCVINPSVELAELKRLKLGIWNAAGIGCIEHLPGTQFGEYQKLLEHYNVSRTSNYIGIKNLGATCYMNSYLQSLFWSRKFRDSVYSIAETFGLKELPKATCDKKSPPDTDNLEENVSILRDLTIIFTLMEKGKFMTIDLSVLPKNSLLRMGPQTMQQDVSEYSNRLLTSLDAECSRLGEHWKGLLQPASLFRGKMHHTVVCRICGSVSASEDCFREISLTFPLRSAPVEPDVKKQTDQNEPVSATSEAKPAAKTVQPVLLENLIRSHFFVEQLRGANKYYCQKCESKTSARKLMSITEFPEYLQMCLERYRYDCATHDAQRLSNEIDFPVVLNFSRSEFGQVTACTRDKRQCLRYELFAILEHHGSCATSGHYCAKVKVGKGGTSNTTKGKPRLSESCSHSLQRKNKTTSKPKSIISIASETVKKEDAKPDRSIPLDGTDTASKESDFVPSSEPATSPKSLEHPRSPRLERENSWSASSDDEAECAILDTDNDSRKKRRLGTAPEFTTRKLRRKEVKQYKYQDELFIFDPVVSDEEPSNRFVDEGPYVQIDAPEHNEAEFKDPQNFCGSREVTQDRERGLKGGSKPFVLLESSVDNLRGPKRPQTPSKGQQQGYSTNKEAHLRLEITDDNSHEWVAFDDALLSAWSPEQGHPATEVGEMADKKSTSGEAAKSTTVQRLSSRTAYLLLYRRRCSEMIPENLDAYPEHSDVFEFVNSLNHYCYRREIERKYQAELAERVNEMQRTQVEQIVVRWQQMLETAKKGSEPIDLSSFRFIPSSWVRAFLSGQTAYELTTCLEACYESHPPPECCDVEANIIQKTNGQLAEDIYCGQMCFRSKGSEETSWEDKSSDSSPGELADHSWIMCPHGAFKISPVSIQDGSLSLIPKFIVDEIIVRRAEVNSKLTKSFLTIEDLMTMNPSELLGCELCDSFFVDAIRARWEITRVCSAVIEVLPRFRAEFEPIGSSLVRSDGPDRRKYVNWVCRKEFKKFLETFAGATMTRHFNDICAVLSSLTDAFGSAGENAAVSQEFVNPTHIDIWEGLFCEHDKIEVIPKVSKKFCCVDSELMNLLAQKEKAFLESLWRLRVSGPSETEMPESLKIFPGLKCELSRSIKGECLTSFCEACPGIEKPKFHKQALAVSKQMKHLRWDMLPLSPELSGILALGDFCFSVEKIGGRKRREVISLAHGCHRLAKPDLFWSSIGAALAAVKAGSAGGSFASVSTETNSGESGLPVTGEIPVSGVSDPTDIIIQLVAYLPRLSQGFVRPYGVCKEWVHSVSDKEQVLRSAKPVISSVLLRTDYVDEFRKLEALKGPSALFDTCPAIEVLHYTLEDDIILEIKTAKMSTTWENETASTSMLETDLRPVVWSQTPVCGMVVYPMGKHLEQPRNFGSEGSGVFVGRVWTQRDFDEDITSMRSVIGFAPALVLEHLSTYFPDSFDIAPLSLYVVVMLECSEAARR